MNELKFISSYFNIVLSSPQPNHNIVALFELKVPRNSYLALLFSIMQLIPFSIVEYSTQNFVKSERQLRKERAKNRHAKQSGHVICTFVL